MWPMNAVRPYRKWKRAFSRWVAGKRPGSCWSTAQAARALGSSPPVARNQMFRLANLGRVRRDEDGNWRRA